MNSATLAGCLTIPTRANPMHALRLRNFTPRFVPNLSAHICVFSRHEESYCDVYNGPNLKPLKCLSKEKLK